MLFFKHLVPGVNIFPELKGIGNPRDLQLPLIPQYVGNTVDLYPRLPFHFVGACNRGSQLGLTEFIEGFLRIPKV